MIYVRGIIVPTKWDEHGNVITLGIETFDEEFYAIDGLTEFPRLVSLLRQEVELGGDVYRQTGRKIICVENVRTLRT